MTTAVRERFAHLRVAELGEVAGIRSDSRADVELCASVRQFGILEPLVVVPSIDGARAEVLCGHRRLDACRRVGLTIVPCVLRDRPDGLMTDVVQLVENVDRATLDAIDEARVYGRMRDAGWTQARIAQAACRSQGHISKRLALLDHVTPTQVAKVGVSAAYASTSRPNARTRNRPPTRAVMIPVALYQQVHDVCGGDVDGFVTGLLERAMTDNRRSEEP